MALPIINTGLVSDISVNQLYFSNKDDALLDQINSYDNLILLAKGRLKVFINTDQEVDYTAPVMLLITANKSYDLVALENDVVVYFVRHLPAV